MLEKKILEPDNRAYESYLSKLRDINIRFDENGRSSTSLVLEDCPKKELNFELPRISVPPHPSVSSRKGIFQSFAQYRDQLHHEFHHLKSDILEQTQKTYSTSSSLEDNEDKKEKKISSYSTEFAFEIPSHSQEKESDWLTETCSIPAFVLPKKTPDSESEMVLENSQREIDDKATMEKKVMSEPLEVEKEPISLPENPFAQLLAEKKQATSIVRGKSSSIGMWQQKLSYFAAAGMTCGAVILGMAICHGNTAANIWNLGFSFSIAGVTSLMAAGILFPFGKISRPA